MLVAAGCSSSAVQVEVQLVGTSCQEQARSFGKELQNRQLAVLDSKWSDFEARRAALSESRLQVARALDAASNPPTYDGCSPERFLSIVEQELGPRFRGEVPPAYADLGPKLDWQWYRELLQKDIEVAMGQPE